MNFFIALVFFGFGYFIGKDPNDAKALLQKGIWFIKGLFRKN